MVVCMVWLRVYYAAREEVRMLRVVGAGLGRTGTLSLKLALEQLLGAPCYHMHEVLPRPAHAERWTAAARGQPVDWHALFDGFGATVDWPSASFWPELGVAFPEAIVLLSTRDAAGWWKSASDTIFRRWNDREPSPVRGMAEAIFQNRFTHALNDREACIAAYEQHNARVRSTVPRERLVEWSPGDGWGPLCAALKLPVPEAAFPHANTTEEFQARFAAPK
jgi:hypothetical protein